MRCPCVMLDIVRLNTKGGFIDGVLWAVDLMDLSSGLLWPLTLLCWWTVRGSFNIHTMALQVLSEINGVVKDECPLDQEWISQTVVALRFCSQASTCPLSHSVCPNGNPQHPVDLSQLYNRGVFVPGVTTAAPTSFLFLELECAGAHIQFSSFN